MSKSKDFMMILNEMGFTRQGWIKKVRDMFLGGALGEYAKLVIARQIGLPKSGYTYWINEVTDLLSNIDVYMTEDVKVSSKDRKRMLKEAYSEASTFQYQITAAKNELVKKYIKKYDQIRSIRLISQQLIIEMVKEFLPQYSWLLGNEIKRKEKKGIKVNNS